MYFLIFYRFIAASVAVESEEKESVPVPTKILADSFHSTCFLLGVSVQLPLAVAKIESNSHVPCFSSWAESQNVEIAILSVPSR